MKIATLVLAALVFGGAAFGAGHMSLRCHVRVPREYRKTPFNPPPNGEPEPVRYSRAYEAFWWNCVAVRAAKLDGRCPFAASGTPAASAGAVDGAMNADEQIDGLLKHHSPSKVQRYLRTLASTKEAKRAMSPYFDSPTPERVN